MSCGLRDVLGFEGLDRPAVLVASSAFADAAVHQSAALGQPDLQRVLVAIAPVDQQSSNFLPRLFFIHFGHYRKRKEM